MEQPNTLPRYIGTPKAWVVSIATANTNRDGTGTVGTLATAGTSGSLIDLVRVVASVTTTAGVVRLFLHDGTNYFLYKELLVTAITPSTTQEVFTVEYTPTSPLYLPSGWSLRASTHNSETFKLVATGGDF